MKPIQRLNAAYSRRSLSSTFANGKVPAQTQMYINGQFVDSKPDRWIDVHNPATQEVVTKVPNCTQAEMERAVEAASAAFPSWSKTSPLRRQEIMFRYQNLVKSNLVRFLSRYFFDFLI